MTSLKESLKYPISNLKDVLVVGTIFLIAALINYILIINGHQDTLELIIINFLVGAFVFGFLITIVRFTLEEKDKIPIFYFKKHFKLGIKASILKTLYFIIPTIFIIILSISMGTHVNAVNGVLNSTIDSLNQSYHLSGIEYANTIFNVFLNKNNWTIAIFGLIIYIIFDGLTFMAYGRLAETGSLKKSLNLKLIYYKFVTYGWKNFTKWYIQFLIIAEIFLLISALLSLIPYVGFIIVSFLVTPYYLMFKYRSIGDMYETVTDYDDENSILIKGIDEISKGLEDIKTEIDDKIN
jgi:hypothetical protein